MVSGVDGLRITKSMFCCVSGGAMPAVKINYVSIISIYGGL